MERNSQVNAGAIFIIVIVLVIIVYLYYSGTFNSLSGQQRTNTLIPISINASAVGPVNNLYPNTPFTVSSIISNKGNKSVNVSIIGYGCNLAPQQTSKMYVNIPADNSTTTNWTFESPETGSCDVQFMTCFNAKSSAKYSIVLVNPYFTGSTPNAVSNYSESPVIISLGGFSNNFRAPEHPINQTLYIYTYLQGTGFLENSSLNWLSIGIEGQAYLPLTRGLRPISNSTVNITESGDSSQLYDTGSTNLPIEVVLNPISNPPGYSNNTILSISTGYTYCLKSEIVPVSVG
ncbi:MAG: hypothetical protein M1433_02060 [Candidatus Parvarchaeota archaeon]|nr:hypothetical protein [Candidatus Parvarchaeota archaeon]